MLDLSPWGWVALAWGQLILFYLGYLGYLNWRYRAVKARLEDEASRR